MGGSRTTSGSTGMPVTVLGTELDARFFKAFELRTLLWHGLTSPGLRRPQVQGQHCALQGGDRYEDVGHFSVPDRAAGEAQRHERQRRATVEWLARHDPESDDEPEQQRN
jgi:hypothetical protein